MLTLLAVVPLLSEFALRRDTGEPGTASDHVKTKQRSVPSDLQFLVSLWASLLVMFEVI
jgi:hypothetical protein